MGVYAITGGCGFIGSHIAEELVSSGNHQIRIIDNLSSGRIENIAHLGNRVEFVRADVRDIDAMRKNFKGVDYVFHEAALVSVFDSVDRPFDNHDINITGTLNVLQAAREAAVRRVVLASSAAVYGNNPDLPKKENMIPEPESPYAAAKIMDEYYARVYSNLYELSVVCLRYFNVFGSRQDPTSPYSGVISIFIDRILAGRPVKIFGDGAQTRDFVFVKDVVQANVRAMHCGAIKGHDAFNVATETPTDLLTLLRIVNELNGSRIEPAFEPARAGDIKHSLADISKARKVLGYAPAFSLAAGLKELVASVRLTARAG